jgi:hypothetical protein
MKVTVLHAEPEDMILVAHIVRAYRDNGYANGDRPKQRDCVVYGTGRAAAVWGGPDHIRIAFEKDTSHDPD